MNEHPIHRILFLDIETVCGEKDFSKLKPELASVWKIKASQLLKKPAEEIEAEELDNYYQDRAAIYAEFGKIICISVGFINVLPKNNSVVKVKSYYGDDEKELLEAFSTLLNNHYSDSKNSYICGHNIIEFDIPYICRRLLINGQKLPNILRIQGKKPWELSFMLDTMQLWKFGDYKAYSSLKLLTAVFDIPTPKDDIDGSEVGKVYWKDEDLKRIVVYCEKDVVAVIQLMMKFKGLPLFEEKQIESVTKL